METAHNSRIFTIFEGASEIQRVITGSDVRYPADPGYRYYRGTSSKTGRLTGKRAAASDRVERAGPGSEVRLTGAAGRLGSLPIAFSAEFDVQRAQVLPAEIV